MPAARFRNLCLDAVDPGVLAAFWSAVLGLDGERTPHGDAVLRGSDPAQTIRVERVAELKTVKHRVHLDVFAADLAGLHRLGARTVLPAGDGRAWTVLADVEGGEFCAFLRPEPPGRRLLDVVVDCADPAAQARWWGEVFEAEVVEHPEGYASVRGVAGMPARSMDFVPVPEPKTARNRVHWDVTVDEFAAVLDRGARLVRPPAGERDRAVLADPEGNEFGARVRPPLGS